MVDGSSVCCRERELLTREESLLHTIVGSGMPVAQVKAVNIADTAGINSLIIQTDVENSEGAGDTVLTLNQILAAVGELH